MIITRRAFLGYLGALLLVAWGERLLGALWKAGDHGGAGNNAASALPPAGTFPLQFPISLPLPAMVGARRYRTWLPMIARNTARE